MDRPRSSHSAALVVALVVVLAIVTARGGDRTLYPAPAGTGVTIYTVDDGFHTDLALPTAAIEAQDGPLARAARQTSKGPWMLVGWGDARFYEATSPWQGRLLDGLRALLGGRPTIVHLQGFSQRPDQAWPTGVHAIVVSPAGLAALIARANHSSTLAPSGDPVLSPATHAADEAFFASGEEFSLIHLCNHWAAELLNAAGLPVTPVLDTLPAGLALDLRLRAGA